MLKIVICFVLWILAIAPTHRYIQIVEAEMIADRVHPHTALLTTTIALAVVVVLEAVLLTAVVFGVPTLLHKLRRT